MGEPRTRSGVSEEMSEGHKGVVYCPSILVSTIVLDLSIRRCHSSIMVSMRDCVDAEVEMVVEIWEG